MQSDVLAQGLRRLIDTPSSVELAEVVDVPLRLKNTHPRLWARGVALVAAIAAVVVASWLVLSGSNSSDVVVRPAITPQVARLPDSCTATIERPAGCPTAPNLASSYLGFEVRSPAHLPPGFTQLGGHLRRYVGEDPTDPNHDVYLYNQAWAVVDDNGAFDSWIQLRQRRADLPGDPPEGDAARCFEGDPRHVLRDGSVACGDFVLTWTANGVWYSLHNFAAVSDEELVRIANSLR